MKNSSRLLAKIDRNRDPFQQRDRLVLGELEHPLVEPQPAFLAVEVAAGRKVGALTVPALGRPTCRTADTSSWALMLSRLSAAASS